MIKSDLFIINKIDLAKYVGADLDRMKSDSEMFRENGTFLFTNLKKIKDWMRSLIGSRRTACWRTWKHEHV